MNKPYLIITMTAFFSLLYYMQHSCCKTTRLASHTTTAEELSTKMRTNKKHAITEPIAGMITTHDKVILAYHAYIPQQPKAALIFYHGGGAHGLAGYDYMAEQLAHQHNIATYLFDIRGHGKSTGARGDAPHSSDVWKDVDTARTHITQTHPSLPLFLGGHSSGAGMLVNYAMWSKTKEPHGYLFVTPMLGRYAHTHRERKTTHSNKRPFASVNTFALMLHHLTRGLIAGSWNAVHFNYSDELVKDLGFITDYTVNMAQAMHPYDPHYTLAHVKAPTYIFVADEDELFDPAKMDRFLAPITQINSQLQVIHIAAAYHLAILGEIDAYIAQCITQVVK